MWMWNSVKCFCIYLHYLQVYLHIIIIFSFFKNKWDGWYFFQKIFTLWWDITLKKYVWTLVVNILLRIFTFPISRHTVACLNIRIIVVYKMYRGCLPSCPFHFLCGYCVELFSIFKYEVDKSEKLPEFEYLRSSFAVWMINPTSWRYKAIQVMHFLWGELWQFVFFRELFYFIGTARWQARSLHHLFDACSVCREPCPFIPHLANLSSFLFFACIAGDLRTLLIS